MTQRKHDANGWYTVDKNPLTKVGVFPYLGATIGAPDPDRIYQVFRPAEELSRPETLESFKLMPLIDDHEMLGGAYTDAADRSVSGTVGDMVVFEDGTIWGNLKVFSEKLAKRIAGGKRDLSVGYRCLYEFSEGSYNGVKYDAIQRNILGNHVALVDEGRMGREVAVLDKMCITLDEKECSKMANKLLLNKARKAAKEFLAAMDEVEKNAKDNGEVDLSSEDETEVEKAEDETETETEDETEVKKAEDETETETEDEDEKSEDESEAEKAKGEGMDALDSRIKKLSAENAVLKKQIASRVTLDSVYDDARKKKVLIDKVVPHTGVFDHSAMTFDAACVYVAKKLGIRVSAGQEEAAINGFLSGKKASVALDSSVAKRKSSGQVADYLSGKK